jgi:hypothetical protein
MALWLFRFCDPDIRKFNHLVSGYWLFRGADIERLFGSGSFRTN